MAFQCFEIKTEADTNDITECSRDDKPSTGMFPVEQLRTFPLYSICFDVSTISS